MSNDPIPRQSILENNNSLKMKNTVITSDSNGYYRNSKLIGSNISSTPIEVKSNLELDWMGPETRISHCTLN